jgi:hypothetical protein
MANSELCDAPTKLRRGILLSHSSPSTSEYVPDRQQYKRPTSRLTLRQPTPGIPTSPGRVTNRCPLGAPARVSER